jgi:hypothetical protein
MAVTVEKTPITDPLDSYLLEVVRTLQTAVAQGMRNVRDHPDVTQKNVSDCEEILDVIMEGNVQEWTS